MIFQVATSEPSINTGTASTGVKLLLPLSGNIRVVEFGVRCDSATAIGAGLVLQLRSVDGVGNAVSLATLTTTAGATVGKITKRLVDVIVDRTTTLVGDPNVAGNRVVINGVESTDSDGYTAVDLNESVIGAASSTGTFYIKFAVVGSQAAAALGEVIVTV